MFVLLLIPDCRYLPSVCNMFLSCKHVSFCVVCNASETPEVSHFTVSRFRRKYETNKGVYSLVLLQTADQFVFQLLSNHTLNAGSPSLLL